jgi:hypothetical protein
MKAVISLVVGLTFFTECLTPNQKPLNKLVIINSEVEITLTSVVKEELNYQNLENCIFLFITDRLENEIEVRIAIIDKRELRIDPKNEPYGFFEFNNKTGFVFGDIVDDFFKTTKEKKSFVYLKEIKDKATKSNTLPPPPNVVEPEVWKYSFTNNKMNFVKVSREHIL